MFVVVSPPSGLHFPSSANRQYVQAKDCLELYRLWLQTQEVQSRTIKSRDFAGVDVAELDLIEPERFA